MRLTSDQALELSKGFRGLAIVVGDYRYREWEHISRSQRQAIENWEWSLLNAAGDIITLAVGKVIDETKVALAKLNGSTADARSAVKKLTAVKGVINVATAAVALAGAIISGNTVAIVATLGGLVDATVDATKEKDA